MAKKISQQRIQELLNKINPSAIGSLADIDMDLYNSGVLDSISTVQLVQDLEGELDTVFSYSDMTADNFKSIRKIRELLTAKYDCEVL